MSNTSSSEIQSIGPDEGTYCAIYTKENCQNRIHTVYGEKGKEKVLEGLQFPGASRIVRSFMGIKCWMCMPSCTIVDVIEK
jgi:hypothetical protein